jgi:hypothetical protein
MTTEAADRVLDELRKLKPDWDSYKSSAIKEAAIHTAEVLLTAEPTVVPCSDGGLQFEWHTRGIDFEFRIAPDGREDWP